MITKKMWLLGTLTLSIANCGSGRGSGDKKQTEASSETAQLCEKQGLVLSENGQTCRTVNANDCKKEGKILVDGQCKSSSGAQKSVLPSDEDGVIVVDLKMCYGQEQFNFASYKIKSGENTLYQSEEMEANMSRSGCVESFRITLDEGKLNKGEEYRLELTLFSNMTIVKVFVIDFIFSKEDESSNPDLWPGEGDLGKEDKCYKNKSFVSCQELIGTWISQNIDDKNSNNPTSPFMITKISNSKTIGTLVLMPGKAGVDRGTYKVLDTAVIDPKVPQWARAFGYSSGIYEVRNGRLAIRSSDQLSATYFVYTTYNGSAALTGTFKQNEESLDVRL